MGDNGRTGGTWNLAQHFWVCKDSTHVKSHTHGFTNNSSINLGTFHVHMCAYNPDVDGFTFRKISGQNNATGTLARAPWRLKNNGYSWSCNPTMPCSLPAILHRWGVPNLYFLSANHTISNMSHIPLAHIATQLGLFSSLKFLRMPQTMLALCTHGWSLLIQTTSSQ